MTTIRLTPKQTTVREGWQWTGQPREEWPAWVSSEFPPENIHPDQTLRIWGRLGYMGLTIVSLTNWLVLTTDADGVTAVTPYTDDALWKEFEG